jgi:hypothetical protein
MIDTRRPDNLSGIFGILSGKVRLINQYIGVLNQDSILIAGDRENTLITYKGKYLLPFNQRIFGSGLNTWITYRGNVINLIINEKQSIISVNS